MGRNSEQKSWAPNEERAGINAGLIDKELDTYASRSLRTNTRLVDGTKEEREIESELFLI